MKRIVYFIATLLFALAGIYSVISYSNAQVENKVAVTITDPSNGLVAFVPLQEQLSIRQGETGAALSIANNLHTSISYSLDYDDRLHLVTNSDSLGSGGSGYIKIGIPNDYPIGNYNLPITLRANFEGGRAHILTNLAIYVEQGDLRLNFDDNGFISTWNGGSTPEGTAILYRYKPHSEADEASEWGGWFRMDENGGVFDEPGEYEFKAKFGGAESEVIARNVARPEPEEDETEPQQEQQPIPKSDGERMAIEGNEVNLFIEDSETDLPLESGKVVDLDEVGTPLVADDFNNQNKEEVLPETE